MAVGPRFADRLVRHADRLAIGNVVVRRLVRDADHVRNRGASWASEQRRVSGAQALAKSSARDGASARHVSSAQRQSAESSNSIRIAAPRPLTAE
jgi:hypothetical protein